MATVALTMTVLSSIIETNAVNAGFTNPGSPTVFNLAVVQNDAEQVSGSKNYYYEAIFDAVTLL
jgi:hypothetical protein